MTSRVFWTETLRTRLAALKKAGAPFQIPPVAIDDTLIRQVQSMRRRGLYRSEIAGELGLNTARVDAIISAGRDEGYDMDMNEDIYSDRRARHGMRSGEKV